MQTCVHARATRISPNTQDIDRATRISPNTQDIDRATWISPNTQDIDRATRISPNTQDIDHLSAFMSMGGSNVFICCIKTTRPLHILLLAGYQTPPPGVFPPASSPRRFPTRLFPLGLFPPPVISHPWHYPPPPRPSPRILCTIKNSGIHIIKRRI